MRMFVNRVPTEKYIFCLAVSISVRFNFLKLPTTLYSIFVRWCERVLKLFFHWELRLNSIANAKFRIRLVIYSLVRENWSLCKQWLIVLYIMIWQKCLVIPDMRLLLNTKAASRNNSVLHRGFLNLRIAETFKVILLTFYGSKWIAFIHSFMGKQLNIFCPSTAIHG